MQNKEYKTNCALPLHTQGSGNALVINIKSKMRSGFSPVMPSLICFSVLKSYLCWEENAVRVKKKRNIYICAQTLFSMETL